MFAIQKFRKLSTKLGLPRKTVASIASVSESCQFRTLHHSLSQFQLHVYTEIYIPFLTAVINNLEDCFPDLPTLQKFNVFSARAIPDGDMTSHGEDYICELAEHFLLPVEDIVISGSQCTDLCKPRVYKTADKSMMWIKENLLSLFKLATVGVLPTSTTDCEHWFSTLKRVKTANRANLTNKMLNALLTISIQRLKMKLLSSIRGLVHLEERLFE